MIDTAEIVSYHDLISQQSEINAAIKWGPMQHKACKRKADLFMAKF